MAARLPSYRASRAGTAGLQTGCSGDLQIPTPGAPPPLRTAGLQTGCNGDLQIPTPAAPSFAPSHRAKGGTRLSSFLVNAALLLPLLASPLALRAQFHPPNPDELRMTSDPQAPGAAAVVLDYEENDVPQADYKTYYTRIKVLTEAGKEAATVSIEYLKGNVAIGSIAGRTIHPDGTIVPLTVKPADLLDVKSGDFRYEKKVFNMPSVEVGSVLEYTYQVRDTWRAPTWWVQQKYFVHKEHFLFIPILADFAYQLVWPNLPRGASVKRDVAGRFTLDIADVPPAPDEEWMPPIRSLLYNVRFYYASFYHSTSVEDYWKDGANYWSKDIDKFADPTKTIRAAVSGLVSPADTDLDKARKLYAAVQALDNTDFSRAKSESERRELKLKEVNRAEDVWTQKSGDSNQIALLYLAMLRAAGLTAYAMQVVNRDDGVFDPSYLSLWQLDDDLVILSSGGKELVLDPGEKMCPFGLVNWRHSDAEGLRQSAQGPGRAKSPGQIFNLNTVRREGDLALDEHGGVSGSIQIVMTGQEALYWRQAALQSDETDLRKQFDEKLKDIVPLGVEAHLDHFLALDRPDLLLMAVVKVKGTLGSAMAKRLILPAFFFESRAPLPFVNQEKRQEPIDMHYPGRTTDQITYALPPGTTVEGAPQENEIPWQGRVNVNGAEQARALYVTKTKTDPGQITVARVLATTFTQVPAGDYQGLRGFFKNAATADQQQIVLNRTAVAKGN